MINFFIKLSELKKTAPLYRRYFFEFIILKILPVVKNRLKTNYRIK